MNDGEDLILVEEKWIYFDRICELNIKYYKLIAPPIVGKKVDCILIGKNIKNIILNNFSNTDMVVIAMPGKPGSVPLLMVS